MTNSCKLGEGDHNPFITPPEYHPKYACLCDPIACVGCLLHSFNKSTCITTYNAASRPRLRLREALPEDLASSFRLSHHSAAPALMVMWAKVLHHVVFSDRTVHVRPESLEG